MAELKKLPRSSWARTDTVWRDKYLKRWHLAEPPATHPEQPPPASCVVGDTRVTTRDPASRLRLDPWDNLQHPSPGETLGMGAPWRDPQAISCVPEGWPGAHDSADPPHPDSWQ